jgi:hypothetical protein
MEMYQQRLKLQAIAAGLLWLIASLAEAAVSQQLFESEVFVRSQAPAERAQAMKSALEEVLVRVAGRNSVLDTQPARNLLEKPARLVQQYRYYTVPGSEPPVLKLWVRFDGEAIRESLQQQGLAYWGADRPDTLVWLAVEDHGSRYVVSADDESEVHRQIVQEARQRGVPVLFPLMDLEDQSQARFSDIWGGFFEHVLTASERYNPQAILIGRLNRSTSGGWSARWYMDVSGRTASWTDSRQQLDALLQQGMDDAADHLASRFAVAGSFGSASTVTISVDGVRSLAAYARVADYLGSLAAVSSWQIEQVHGSGVQYSLQLNGGLQDLTRTVSIGTVLEPVAGGESGTFRLRQ